MKTKLTLSIEEETKKRAKRYAKKKGTSISQMVEQYLKQVAKPDEGWKPKEGSAVARMSGVIKADKDFDYDEVIVEERLKKYENHSG